MSCASRLVLTTALLFQGAGSWGCSIDDPPASLTAPLAVASATEFTSGMVTFTFDDGWVGQATFGAPQLEARGWRGTFFLVPQWLGRTLDGEGFMSIGDARSIAARGHEIGDHTMTHKHLSSLSTDAVRQQMVESKTFLADKLGVSPGDIQSFASPYGDYDARVLASAKGLFSSHRATTDGLNTPQTDPYLLSVVSLGVGHGGMPVHTNATIQGDILRAARERRWLIFLVHGIVVGAPRRATDFELPDFLNILDEVTDSGLRVVTMRQGVDELRDLHEDSSATEDALDRDVGS